MSRGRHGGMEMFGSCVAPLSKEFERAGRGRRRRTGLDLDGGKLVGAEQNLTGASGDRPKLNAAALIAS